MVEEKYRWYMQETYSVCSTLTKFAAILHRITEMDMVMVEDCCSLRSFILEAEIIDNDCPQCVKNRAEGCLLIKSTRVWPNPGQDLTDTYVAHERIWLTSKLYLTRRSS